MSNQNTITNLKTWNDVKQTPSNFLKKIEFGYLKGKSDINPQWRLMAMTQAFGPVGHGWTYRIVRTWSEAAPSGAVMCFAEVAVKTKFEGAWGEEFSGIGGSEIVEIAKGQLKASDEGYKKAVTDALGVAFKAVGVAADVYLGNYDGSKYLYEYDHAYQEGQTLESQQNQGSQQSNQQQNQNTQQPVQQQATPPKFKDTRTQQQIYESALAAIQETADRNVLLTAAKTFKGTKYETGINNACRARSDQMGWPTKQTQRNQNLPQQPMHH
ncbi:hypothetical protein RFI02_19710 [Acinetobacter sichuanensis]|uniref:hypothetical protein n=1 Tax=Acinetobacter sichuanensis TaxID=2136183 RepID=UPI00280FBB65|nr:hypothetical protein [Acinetobacter sichuanensis]MDQ9023326.1 hypothetical protein [Acinetobacter sichuanensis]